MRPEPTESAILSIGAGPNPWDAVWIETGRAPVFATLNPAAIERVLATIENLGARPAGQRLAMRRLDGLGQDREKGKLIAELLLDPGMRPIADRLALLARKAEASGQPIDLLVDCRTGRAGEVPWELLEAAPGDGLMTTGCRVGRLCDGAPPRTRPRCDRMEVVLWSPEPADPICVATRTHIEGCISTLPRSEVVTPEGRPVPPPEHGVFRIIHTICRGPTQLQSITRLAPGGSTSPSIRWMGPSLRGASLVIFDVVDDTDLDAPPLTSPALQLVRGGVGGCIHSRSVFHPEGSKAFHHSLFAALADGMGLMDAVSEGRRALAASPMGARGFEWWSPMLLVGDNAVLAEHPPLQGQSALTAWPRGSTEAEAALTQAQEMARSQGFLGVEHVAHALAHWTSPSPLLTHFQPELANLGRRVVLYSLEPKAIPAPSPRLGAMAASLRGGYELDDLLRLLLSIPWVVAQISPPFNAGAAVGSDDIATIPPLQFPSAPEAPAGSNALYLEVEGGPEDGRTLTLVDAGTVVGRWDPVRPDAIKAPLYIGAVGSDRTTSRRHLRYDGGGAMTPLMPTSVQRPGQPAVDLRGSIVLSVDDRLLLGAGTMLKVLATPG